MTQQKFDGVIVPMITPVDKQGRIDLGAVERIVDNLVSHQTHPFILGTTGESASVPEHYRSEFVKVMVNTSGSRVLTYAGISGNCLETAIISANRYFELGVDAVVAHPPAYYPVHDHQILYYYECLLERIHGPLILYNIPPVTNLSLSLDIVEKLSFHPKVAGFKDSEQNRDRLAKSLKLWAGREDFSYLTGWAAVSAETILNGGVGMVPSAGNLFPGIFSELYKAAKAGDREKAMNLQQDADRIGSAYQEGFILSEALSSLKLMMHKLGLCSPHVLPPLKELDDEQKKLVLNRFYQLKERYL